MPDPLSSSRPAEPEPSGEGTVRRSPQGDCRDWPGPKGLGRNRPAADEPFGASVLHLGAGGNAGPHCVWAASPAPDTGAVAGKALEPTGQKRHYRSMLLWLIALQAAQAAADIQLDVHATVERVKIDQRGDTSLELRASPDGGSRVQVDKPETRGRRQLRNVDVRVRAEARIADPAATRTTPETEPPQ